MLVDGERVAQIEKPCREQSGLELDWRTRSVVWLADDYEITVLRVIQL